MFGQSIAVPAYRYALIFLFFRKQIAAEILDVLQILPVIFLSYFPLKYSKDIKHVTGGTHLKYCGRISIVFF